MTDAIDWSTMPARVDKRQGAELVTRYFFRTSPYTIPDWACWQHRIFVNGRATVETRLLLAEAEQRLAAAPSRRPIVKAPRQFAETEVA
jgi:hypothetical protein